MSTWNSRAERTAINYCMFWGCIKLRVNWLSWLMFPCSYACMLLRWLVVKDTFLIVPYIPFAILISFSFMNVPLHHSVFHFMQSPSHHLLQLCVAENLREGLCCAKWSDLWCVGWVSCDTHTSLVCLGKSFMSLTKLLVNRWSTEELLFSFYSTHKSITTCFPPTSLLSYCLWSRVNVTTLSQLLQNTTV